MSMQKSILSFFKPGSISSKNKLDKQDYGNRLFKRLKSNSSETNKTSQSDISDTKVKSINNLTNNISDENKQIKSDILTGLIYDPPFTTEEPPGTSEEKKLIETKRLEAKLKYLSKNFSILDPDIHPSWVAALESEFSKPYFRKLNDFVENERKTKTVYPPKNQVWTWSKLCPIDEIKVVIIGQDPYHNPGQAHGLAFSVPQDIPKPPSLQNIFKELKREYRDFEEPSHGYLMGWGMQGVLLLNAVLTVNANKPNSHKEQGWEKLTTAVIKYLNDNYKGIVFMLWGAYAQKKASFVDTSKHHILKSAHPSPLSAHKGFLGCNHFRKCNDLLVKQDHLEINWPWLPRGEYEEGGTTLIVPLLKEDFDSRQMEMLRDFTVKVDENNQYLK